MEALTLGKFHMLSPACSHSAAGTLFLFIAHCPGANKMVLVPLIAIVLQLVEHFLKDRCKEQRGYLVCLVRSA